jgi:hypothetical protein
MDGGSIPPGSTTPQGFADPYKYRGLRVPQCGAARKPTFLEQNAHADAHTMFGNNDETAKRNHLLRLLGKAILKLEDAAAVNSPESGSLGAVRAELVQFVKTLRKQTAVSISHVVMLHRIAKGLDAMSDPYILEARIHISSSASLIQGLQHRE